MYNFSTKSVLMHNLSKVYIKGTGTITGRDAVTGWRTLARTVSVCGWRGKAEDGSKYSLANAQINYYVTVKVCVATFILK